MITINELFSGIGAQVAAFKRLNIPYEVIGISEIDKYAIQSYEAINGQVRNYGDITKVPYLDYADLWTYSFPCQDLSFAGKQKGITESTRSGLLLHVERLLEESVNRGNQPIYLLLENVKALVSKKFMPDFQRWLDKLEQLGYNNYWQVLNAKDYGIPQNRERVFVVSIRKDVDTKGYKFPSPIPLQKRLKDMLEPCVDEKYYLSADKVEKFAIALNKKIENQDVSYCIDANYWKGTTPQQFLNKNRRQLVKEISNTIRCGGGGSLDGKHTWDIVVEPKVIQVGNIVSTGNWDNPQRGRIDSPSGYSPALNTCQGGGLESKITEGYRIRKLTPRECWRLMGFTDEEFRCAKASGVSNSQLYKQAGNSIVVNVLEGIFKNLIVGNY